MRGPCSGCFVSWLSSVATAALTVSAASCRQDSSSQFACMKIISYANISEKDHSSLNSEPE